MFLGGLWHGAGWNFAIWGALHGFYLMSNHVWALYTESWSVPIPAAIKKSIAWIITFVAVVVGWVFFRATSFDSAITILQGMSGLNGVSIPNGIMVRLGFLQEILQTLGVSAHLGAGGRDFIYTWLWVLTILPLVLILPNTQDLFYKVGGSLSNKNYQYNNALWPFHSKLNQIYWKKNKLWVTVISIALVCGFLTLTQVSEFLYFQF